MASRLDLDLPILRVENRTRFGSTRFGTLRTTGSDSNDFATA